MVVGADVDEGGTADVSLTGTSIDSTANLDLGLDGRRCQHRHQHQEQPLQTASLSRTYYIIYSHHHYSLFTNHYSLFTTTVGLSRSGSAST